MTLSNKKTLPYGSWPSPFTSEIIAGKNKIFSELKTCNETVYWLERRPEEQGSNILVQWNSHTGIQDITSANFSVGNQVHEYGGGSYAVHNSFIVFSDLYSHGLWIIEHNKKPRLIFQNEAIRFADFCLTDHYIICVCEDHTNKKIINSLILFSLQNQKIYKHLIKGADFYSSPRLSKDQKQLVWIEWDHPFMPWESTRLCLATFDPIHGTIKNKQILAGHLQQESLIEPEWTENNQLLVCSDRQEWWNLYQVNYDDNHQPVLDPIAPIQAEIGKPHWIFGQKSWYFLTNHSIIAQAISQAISKIITINQNKIEILDFDQPESCPIPIGKDQFVWINQSSYRPMEIIYQDHHQKRHILRTSASFNISEKMIAIGKPITFPTQDHQQAHAFFYEPTHQNYQSLKNELPPLLVLAHGGPTGQSFNHFSPKIQFWTSRGFAVIDVNYRGSTGFGKSYREALQKQWGVLDVQDCIDACHYLIKTKKVDPKRIVIKGSSAGGFTVLQALIQSSLFAAASCLYGVGDLTALAQETHKFESHYLTGLIGHYPEEKELYYQRSPLTNLHKINCPLILFQGLKDKVVPPSQADNIIKILKENHIPYAYYTFEEEGHGFRQEHTLKTVLELELAFFGQILGFNPYHINHEINLQS